MLSHPKKTNVADHVVIYHILPKIMTRKMISFQLMILASRAPAAMNPYLCYFYVESAVMSEPLPMASGSFNPSLPQITTYVVSKPSSR